MKYKNKLKIANAVISELWEHFAYEGILNGENTLYHGGLSPLESAYFYLLGEKIINQNGIIISSEIYNINEIEKTFFEEKKDIQCHNCSAFINIENGDSIWFKEEHQYCNRCNNILNDENKKICSKCGMIFDKKIEKCYSIPCILGRSRK